MSLEKRIETLEARLASDDDVQVTAEVMIPYGLNVSEEEIDLAIAAAQAQNPGQPFVFVEIRQPVSGGE
jgi:hypothetical protein